jgi:hypothetical protein
VVSFTPRPFYPGEVSLYPLDRRSGCGGEETKSPPCPRWESNILVKTNGFNISTECKEEDFPHY